MERFEDRDGTSREDLLQRVALMEEMIAEGRRTTGRYGWIFVLWGLVDLAGLGWERLQPGNPWVWPVVLVSGIVLQFVGIAMVRSSAVVGAAGFAAAGQAPVPSPVLPRPPVSRSLVVPS